MKKQIIIYGLLLPLLLCLVSNVTAFDDNVTHPEITEKAMEESLLDQHLKGNLGFRDGLKTYLFLNNKKKPVAKWIKYGSEKEDSPNCRASNHFHNPLMSWDQSYMTDEPWWLDLYCTSWSPWYSNVTWATGYLAPAPDGSKATFSTDPEFAPINWDSAGDSYYSALTATSNKDREAYLTECKEIVS
jgi:hypothetical protein